MKATARGFSLIELVIVIVILGILAATALPRFLDVTEEAKNASVEGVAGGFATGVMLTRAQWEAIGRPQENSNNVVVYDGTKLYLTTPSNTQLSAGLVSPGYPIADTAGSVAPADLTANQCVRVWESILQNPPRITSDFSQVVSQGDFYNYFATVTASGEDSSCLFYLVNSLDKDGNGRYQNPGANVANYKNFTYKPATGQVSTNLNLSDR